MRMGVYQHYKGPFYLVLGIATHSTNGDANGEKLVIYIGLTQKPGRRMFARRLGEFVETVTWHGARIPRFRYVGEEVPDPGEG